MNEPTRPPRRPAAIQPGAFEALMGRERDPATVLEAAHETAAALVRRGRASTDPQVTARLVALVDEIGLTDLAALWSERPARTLPGALWRLYVLREWVRRDPAGASTDYADGLRHADVAALVAGVASPPGPRELRRVVDEILTGVFDGDLGVALHRAAAFCRVVAAGRGAREGTHRPLPEPPPAGDAGWPSELRRAAALLETANDLDLAARAWASGTLD